jgi:hypothetical protein
MKFLIIIAVAALTAILVTVAIQVLDISALEDSSFRSAIVGGLSGGVAVVVSNKIRRKDR